MPEIDIQREIVASFPDHRGLVATFEAGRELGATFPDHREISASFLFPEVVYLFNNHRPILLSSGHWWRRPEGT